MALQTLEILSYVRGFYSGVGGVHKSPHMLLKCVGSILVQKICEQKTEEEARCLTEFQVVFRLLLAILRA